MDKSASEASTPLRTSLRELPATAAVGKLCTPPLVEHAAGLLRRWCGQNIDTLRWHRNSSPPGESLTSWIDRWDYETRILEVNGVLLAAPHTTP
jgi:hypothetical protein